jgi:Uroporphyrinogen decarboxylase (URO-D)
MNARETFLSTMSFEPGAPVLKWEYGYWAGAVRRWVKEGLTIQEPVPETLGDGDAVRAEAMGQKPGGYCDQSIHTLFNLEEGFRRIPVNNFMCPTFPVQSIEDHGDWVMQVNKWGIVERASKDNSSPASFLRSPVQSWEDWEKLKERFQLNLDKRLPSNWPELVKSYKDHSYPLVLGGEQGFYGSPRYLIGDERLLTVLIDDPDLVLAINDYLCNLWISIYDPILQQVDVDMALIWEDMCFKTGPFISPTMFRKFMLPFYKKLTGFFRDHGVKTIFVDTDGNCWKLIPLFMEGGVTGLYPFEVNAGMDVVKVRESFPRLQMIGGIDKMTLFGGEESIDKELEYKVRSIIGQGGFIPTIDHLVPMDVSWRSFKHYRTHLNNMIDEFNAGNKDLS